MVILSYNSNSVNLPDPSIPYRAYNTFKQVMQETETGQRYVYDYGVKRKVFELSWDVLDQTSFNLLQNFIENVVNFMEKIFIYQDVYGISYNVRCTNFTYSQISPLHYSVQIKLEEEV